MKLILHAGLHKTGSSSIQVFCHNQKECLQSSNYFYPDSLILGGAHHPFAACLAEHNFELLEGHITSWISECDQRDLNNIIVSTEDLEYATYDQLLKLRMLLERYSIELNAIIYIRPQSDLVLSQYSQQVREGAYSQSLNTFVAQSIRYADYLQIGAILDIFLRATEGRLEVGFYYDDFHSSINVIDDFAARLRISNVLKYTDSSTYKFNPRLSYIQLEFIKRVVKSNPELTKVSQYDRSQILYKFIQEYNWPEFLANSPKIELSREHIKRIYCQFKDENTKIGSRYLSGAESINKWYEQAIAHSRPERLVNLNTVACDKRQYHAAIESATTYTREIANHWLRSSLKN